MNNNKFGKKNLEPVLNRSRKIFINHMNSWFSNFVIEELRTESVTDPKIVKNEFMGTRNNKQMKLPYLFNPTEIKIDYNPHFEQEIFRNDVYIFNLEEADLNEVEYVIKGLKSLKHQTEKTLIIITSIMTWARTPHKIVKESNNEANEKLTTEDNNYDIKRKVSINIIGNFLPYEDSDYTLRLPAKKYYQYKMIETIAMSASNVNPMLKSYIICPGLTYGCGENVFYEYFKMAWMNDPEKLPVIGDGLNSIPTIHIKDLAALVKRVADRTPEEKYIFAVDRTRNRSLSNIILSISKANGSGLIEYVKDYSAIGKIPAYNLLSIDIKCKTSRIFEDRRGEHEDKEDFIARRFKWECEYGIPENLEKLRKEFNIYRNLKPVKILILGQPVAGKTTLSNLLKEHYDLPVYNIKDVIDSVKNLPEEDHLKKEITAKLEELKDKMIIEYDEAQKKIKGKKKFEPLDRSTLNPRLPDDLVAKLFLRFLTTSLSRNKGYILDGYPKSYQDCQAIFCKDDNDKPESDPSKYSIDPETAPNFLLRLDTTIEEIIKNRIKSNPELVVSNPQHYSEEAVQRRFSNFRNFNETAKTSRPLGSFFVRYNIDIFSMNAKLEPPTLFAESRGYIESKGKVRRFKKNNESKENNLKQNIVEKSDVELTKDINFTKE